MKSSSSKQSRSSLLRLKGILHLSVRGSLMLPPNRAVLIGLGYLTISALLFSLMGVLIRFASYTIDNINIVFYRNAIGLAILLPYFAYTGFATLKTHILPMHLLRSLVGLGAMYCFFYAIAHITLSNAMIFTYAAPVFIPLLSWFFLKERITLTILIATFVGLMGVLMVAKPNHTLLSIFSFIGLASCLLAAAAFVCVKHLTHSEPAIRIVFYFCLFSTIISAIPMFWYWRHFNAHEWQLLIGIGVIATLSQISLSRAYWYAPASMIAPANYLTILFAGIWAACLWGEYPNVISILGMVFILAAVLSNLVTQLHPPQS